MNFDPSLNIEQLSETAMELSGGDQQKAVALLVDWASESEEFIQRNRQTLLVRRFTDGVTHLCKDKRKRLSDKPEDILDFPIWGGLALGNVSIKQIGEAGQRWKQDAQTRMNKADFLFAIMAAAQRHGVDLSSDGGARLIPVAELRTIFANHFGDGAVQDELFGEAA